MRNKKSCLSHRSRYRHQSIVLTYIVSLLGRLNGVIQVRLSEALTILPVLLAAIPD